MSAIVYLGVDIAGSDNTWVAALTQSEDGSPRVCLEPSIRRLEEIREYCVSHHVVAVAVDAQLTMSITDERGFRPSDTRLRELLPAAFKGWVASFNSLMAVPVRGQLLAQVLAPLVATVVETHPRACLFAALEHAKVEDLEGYKNGADALGATSRLWGAWAHTFGVAPGSRVSSDGALDAVVCATVAWLLHRSPGSLLRLGNSGRESIGRGPFYVFRRPTWSPRVVEVPDAASCSPEGGFNDPRASNVEQRPWEDTILDGEPRTYEELRGKRVACPACGEHEFSNWPWGWDAHAAHACSGIDGHSAEVRKETYRMRFAHILPRRRRR